MHAENARPTTPTQDATLTCVAIGNQLQSSAYVPSVIRSLCVQQTQLAQVH